MKIHDIGSSGGGQSDTVESLIKLLEGPGILDRALARISSDEGTLLGNFLNLSFRFEIEAEKADDPQFLEVKAAVEKALKEGAAAEATLALQEAEDALGVIQNHCRNRTKYEQSSWKHIQYLYTVTTSDPDKKQRYLDRYGLTAEELSGLAAEEEEVKARIQAAQDLIQAEISMREDAINDFYQASLARIRATESTVE
jgi:hypothetical protein